MDDKERNDAADEFMAQLHKSPELFKKWMATPKDDAAAIGKLVQDAVGLDQTPTEEDLEAMSAHAAPNLKKIVQTVQPAAVSWTGAMFGTHSL
jgi:hypothetical protein